MNNKVRKMNIILISTAVTILLALWFTGIIGIWLNGIAYIADNMKAFTDVKGYIIPEEYSVSINLDDLKSNIGKVLYNDGSNKIYVSWIDNTGSSKSGGYRIGFRACGKYSLTSAVLVSGVRHATVADNSSTAYMTAKMTASYNGKIYNSGVFGTSGLNYKDGDEFAFYIFPSDAYNNGEISLSEKGIVDISITKLYKNIWTKK